VLVDNDEQSDDPSLPRPSMAADDGVSVVTIEGLRQPLHTEKEGRPLHHLRCRVGISVQRKFIGYNFG
jgi:hypothetical protein